MLLNRFLFERLKPEKSYEDLIEENLYTILETYSSKIEDFGVDYYSKNLENLKTILEREEPRLYIKHMEWQDSNNLVISAEIAGENYEFRKNF